MLTVVNISLASPKSVGDTTLNMLEIMTRAFDESEGGEGTQTCSPNECTSPPALWISGNKLSGSPNYAYVVHTACGFKGLKANMPLGATITAEFKNCLVGYEYNCITSWGNTCCPSMMKHCFYGYDCGGGGGDPA